MINNKFDLKLGFKKDLIRNYYFTSSNNGFIENL